MMRGWVCLCVGCEPQHTHTKKYTSTHICFLSTAAGNTHSYGYEFILFTNTYLALHYTLLRHCCVSVSYPNAINCLPPHPWSERVVAPTNGDKLAPTKRHNYLRSDVCCLCAGIYDWSSSNRGMEFSLIFITNKIRCFYLSGDHESFRRRRNVRDSCKALRCIVLVVLEQTFRISKHRISRAQNRSDGCIICTPLSFTWPILLFRMNMGYYCFEWTCIEKKAHTYFERANVRLCPSMVATTNAETWQSDKSTQNQ